jgi:hypothetical protein
MRDDIFLALGGIKVDREFDSLGLINPKRQIRLFLKVLQTEALQVLFGEGLRVKDARCRRLLPSLG